MIRAYIDMAATGRNIERLLREKNMTVKELAKSLGFATTNAVYKWLRGETLPTIDNLAMLSVVLCVPMDVILVIHKAKEADAGADV